MKLKLIFLGFRVKIPLKILFLAQIPQNQLFLCKNTTFLLSKLFSRMKLKFLFFLFFSPVRSLKIGNKCAQKWPKFFLQPQVSLLTICYNLILPVLTSKSIFCDTPPRPIGKDHCDKRQCLKMFVQLRVKSSFFTQAKKGTFYR